MHRPVSCLCVLALALPPAASAGVRRVTSGVVSITFADEFVNFLNAAGVPLVEINATAEPAPGFDLGLLVQDDATFAINVAGGAFAGFRDSRLNTTGGIAVAAPGFPSHILFDNFAVVRDAEHEPEDFYFPGHISELEIVVTFGDFTLDNVVYDENTGRLIVPEFDIAVAQELAVDVFGVPFLTGSPLAQAHIDVTLAVPDGDADGDLDVDLDDFALFANCATGPGGDIGSALCRAFDFEEDGDIDLLDFAAFQSVYTGPASIVPAQLLVTSSGVAGVTVDVTPSDFFNQGSGVTGFLRTYPSDTQITLTAALESGGRFFARWVVDGVQGDIGVPATDLVVSDFVTADARYQDVVIYEQPDAPSGLCDGDALTLSVTAVGNDLAYQWFHDDDPLPGADAPTLTLDPLSAADSGVYQVVVANDLASLTSDPVDLVVTPGAPVISGQPQGTDLCPGGTIFLFVSASGGTLTYQWFKDGQALPDATGPFLAIGDAGADDSGVYLVEVSNVCGIAISDEAVVDVDPIHCP